MLNKLKLDWFAVVDVLLLTLVLKGDVMPNGELVDVAGLLNVEPNRFDVLLVVSKPVLG